MPTVSDEFCTVHLQQLSFLLAVDIKLSQTEALAGYSIKESEFRSYMVKQTAFLDWDSHGKPNSDVI